VRQVLAVPPGRGPGRSRSRHPARHLDPL